MRVAFTLAIRNLLGAGLRTWLNVGVLSFAFVVILFYKAWIDGWDRKARTDAIQLQYAHGHLRHADFDPLDPFSITDAHGILADPPDDLEPVLVRQASAYPDGRMMPVLLRALRPEQELLELPTEVLRREMEGIPILLGDAMAHRMNVDSGDRMLVRWRDANGTFDAREMVVVRVFENDYIPADMGQIYLSIQNLWDMTGLEGHASYWIAGEQYQPKELAGWTFHAPKELLRDFDRMIESERWGSRITQIILLGIALLAIFDTQVLSVFRRQREIGTYISLGMTRKQVVRIFTVEGATNALLAIVVGGIYGAPLFAWVARVGIPMPAAYKESGLPIAERMFPVFELGMIVTTSVLVLLSALVVSYLPSRKISRMDPVLALKGKIQ